TAPRGLRPHSSLELQHSSAGPNAGQYFAPTDRDPQAIVGAGIEPGRKIDGRIWVVQKDSIKRIIRVVRKRFVGWFGNRASVQDQKIGIGKLPPNSVRAGIFARYDCVTNG